MSYLYTSAVVILVAIFALSQAMLLRRPHHDRRLLADRRDVATYAVSRISAILAVACAVAADASAGTSPMNAVVGIAGLVTVAGLVAFTVHARLSGRFFGLAHMLRAG